MQIQHALKAMQEIDKSLSSKSRSGNPAANTTQDETARTKAVVEDHSAAERAAEEQPKEALSQ